MAASDHTPPGDRLDRSLASDVPVRRRALLKLAGGAAGAFALLGFGGAATASAKDDDKGKDKKDNDDKDDKDDKGNGPLYLNIENTAKKLTSLVSSATSGVLSVKSKSTGIAIKGEAANARAIMGVSTNDVGVFGESTNHVGVVGHGKDRGVHGYSRAGLGMRAASDAGTGIAATSGNPPPGPGGPPAPAPPVAVIAESFNAGGVGVIGKGPDMGVFGGSTTGVGMKGDSVDSIAIVARSTNGQGLVASTDAVNLAAIEGVTTSTDPATFNTGVFGRVQRGHGVQGFADAGIGVKGQTNDPSGAGIGVLGDTAAGVAVKGYSRDTTGIGIGVLGESATGTGMKGYVGAPGGFGMIGEAPYGSGVFGTSWDGNGLHGYSANGLALYVQGRAWFDSMVLVPIAAGTTTGTLATPFARIGAAAIATLQDHAVGASIDYVKVPAAGTVEVHLTAPAAADGYAAVLLFN